MKKIISLLKITFSLTFIFSCNKTETTPQAAPPTIDSFSPIKDSMGGVITISGKNFSPNIANNEVKFNSTIATIISATNTSLKVTVPNGLPSASTITIKTSGQTATSTTSFKLASPLELLIVGKWYYKYSIRIDTEYVSSNNQILTIPWPFLAGQNPATNFDTSYNFINFLENGTVNNSQFGWGIGQSGNIYRDTVSYAQTDNNIYLSFQAGINNYSSPAFSYPAYQDTIIVNSITQKSLVIFRKYHQKHYANSNNILNNKQSLDSLIKY